MHLIDRNDSSSDDDSKDMYAAKLVWPTKAKPLACSSLQPVQKNRQEEVKFNFNVAKCDKIFDELLKSGNNKITHTIQPLNELKNVLIVSGTIPFLMPLMIASSFIDMYNRL
jgi:hypothetical protein